MDTYLILWKFNLLANMIRCYNIGQEIGKKELRILIVMHRIM